MHEYDFTAMSTSSYNICLPVKPTPSLHAGGIVASYRSAEMSDNIPGIRWPKYFSMKENS